jgi:2-polyprenyl-6-methoxyphenol hydroxylase-like FAD-dependent oxidoreductase
MTTSSQHDRRGEHAVIIGASMGGLVAAAAVAPYFDHVTVVDRDTLPSGPDHRRGVPQSKHTHGFQPGGLMALDELLPGLTDSLVAGGAKPGDVSHRCGWYVGGGDLARGVSGFRGMGLTRPFVEHAVRSRVAALANVTLRDRTEVVRPLTRHGDLVVGVEITAAGRHEADSLPADLVIDASGRTSRLPEWLDAMGLPTPEEERVHCRMAYLTRRWRFTNDVMGEDIFQVVTPDRTPHFGVCAAQEDGSYIVTLGGLLDSAPAKTDEAFHTFARGLPQARIADALEGAEPLTGYQPAHFPYSRRHRFDRLAKHPVGLLALGHAIASFNPMYGQGMSVAALEGVALRDLLHRGPVDPKTYYKQAHRLEDVAWKISTGGDLRFDAVVGRRTADMRVMNAYLDRLARIARTDATLAQAFLRVAGFVDRPESLFRPSVVWRVLRGRHAVHSPTVDAPRNVAARRAASPV